MFTQDAARNSKKQNRIYVCVRNPLHRHVLGKLSEIKTKLTDIIIENQIKKGQKIGENPLTEQEKQKNP